VRHYTSALKRARASLEQKLPSGGHSQPVPAANSPTEDAIVGRFVAAYESADLGSLVKLLTDDVFISMPPLPFEYEGLEPVSLLFASIFGSGRKFDLVSTRANGQPALGAYVRGPDGTSHGVGLFVLTLAGDEICAMTRFENTVLPWFVSHGSGYHDRYRAGSRLSSSTASGHAGVGRGPRRLGGGTWAAPTGFQPARLSSRVRMRYS